MAEDNKVTSNDAAGAAESVDPLPVWVDENHIDPGWIRHHTKLPCTECLVEDISNQARRGGEGGPKDGATLKLTVTLEEPKEDDGATTIMTLVVKQVPPKGRPLSQQLGLAREALFYNQLASDVHQSVVKSGGGNDGGDDNNQENNRIIPKIRYAHGDMSSGAKVVIMEDLSKGYLDSGIFFGPGNPNNWTRDLPTMVAKAGPIIPTAAQVAKRTFVELAQVHATFWCRMDLLDSTKYNFLRGHSWLQGQDKPSWEASQGLLTTFWSAYLEREKNHTGDDSKGQLLQWDPVVRAAVEKSLEGISWDAQLQRLNKDGRWTIVHGDCWPGNFMWMIQNNNNNNNNSDSDDATMLKLLDWEMVGVGSGPQDLGQYVLSNMDPQERRDCENELIKAYYEELTKCGVTNVDWDYCWNEYKIGGVERWLWFLIYFAGQPPETLPGWAQFFHNQISAFMKDHQITPNDIVQPRP